MPDWPRNGRRSRSPETGAAGFRPQRFATDDLHLDQAGRGPQALGIDAAALRKTSLRPEKRGQTGMPPHRPAPGGDRRAAAARGFQGDTVLGPAGTGGLATLVDRKARFTIVVKVQSKNADHVHGKSKAFEGVGRGAMPSITFDNGSEFARCYRLEKHLGMELYFAYPGCPYQRGTNENTNGLIRQYFPKGTDFRDISHRDPQFEKLFNNRPRRRLGFRTPARFSSRKLPLPVAIHNLILPGALGGQSRKFTKGPTTTSTHTMGGWTTATIRQGFPIGSGVTEAACKTVFTHALQGIGNDVEAEGRPDDPGSASSPIERRVENRHFLQNRPLAIPITKPAHDGIAYAKAA